MGRIQNWMRPIAVHSELDNFLIIVVIGDGYSAVVAVLCVVDRRWHTMHDYMKALQKRFDRQPHPELYAQVEYAQEELRRDMDAAGRRKLLRLLDAQNTLLVEAKLMSFTAGFKLAWGMAKELEADGLYSFEREEEERICHPAEQED